MRVTINEVKKNLGITETYDIVNAIRNSNGDQFKNYVPLANAENVAEIGKGIMLNQTVQNEFITSLVDRIGLTVVRQVQLQNPLAKFKKGQMPQGRTIEEVFTDITKAKKYDPEDAENTVFKRTIPNVKTLFHERNRQDRYDQTIQDESLQSAFNSWSNFENFVSSIINAIYNSAEVDEYEYMKLLLDNYHAEGLFTTVPIEEPNTETTAREFVKKMRATARKMTLPTGTRDYNSLAVRTRTEMNNLHLIIDADVEAQLDVDVLAKAFNMDKTDFLGKVTVIDGFASKGLEAVLIDDDFFMVYDNLQKMETIRNPKGLYWNYFFHVWQTLSLSRFSNAVAFVSGDVPDVSQVIVDPTIATVKAGKEKEFTAYVRANDEEEHEVKWEVKATDGSDKEDDTEIDDDGKLKVADDQKGELKVIATVEYGGEDDDGDDETKEVKGESIVSITPQ